MGDGLIGGLIGGGFTLILALIGMARAFGNVEGQVKRASSEAVRSMLGDGKDNGVLARVNSIDLRIERLDGKIDKYEALWQERHNTVEAKADDLAQGLSEAIKAHTNLTGQVSTLATGLAVLAATVQKQVPTSPPVPGPTGS